MDETTILQIISDKSLSAAIVILLLWVFQTRVGPALGRFMTELVETFKKLFNDQRADFTKSLETLGTQHQQSIKDILDRNDLRMTLQLQKMEQLTNTINENTEALRHLEARLDQCGKSFPK